MPAYFVCVIVLLSDYMLANFEKHTLFLRGFVRMQTPQFLKIGFCV